ncbi:PhoH family protein [Candidatus Mycalebacterium sp.]
MNMERITDELIFENSDAARHLFGSLNGNLNRIEKLCGVTVNSRGSNLLISGPADNVEGAKDLATQLYELITEGYKLAPEDFESGAEIVSSKDGKIKDVFLASRPIEIGDKKISPKTPCQREYIAAIRHNTIVFGTGPAGTGKTYLAVAVALSELSEGNVSRMIITRPMLEAGESLGFLPGDLEQKSDPFLRPFFDAIYEIVGMSAARRMIEKKIIEVVPLAYMRGRTLNGAFVILDEAQNTTSAQMKMFLTRMGFNSKAVVTGDTTQTDLPAGKSSGLAEAERLFGGMEGIEITRFSRRDVVRHPLVKKILDVYDKEEKPR